MRLFARLLTLQLCLTLEVIPKIGMPTWQEDGRMAEVMSLKTTHTTHNRHNHHNQPLFLKKKAAKHLHNLVAMLGERDPPRGPKLPARCADAFEKWK